MTSVWISFCLICLYSNLSQSMQFIYYINFLEYWNRTFSKWVLGLFRQSHRRVNSREMFTFSLRDFSVKCSLSLLERFLYSFCPVLPDRIYMYSYERVGWYLWPCISPGDSKNKFLLPALFKMDCSCVISIFNELYKTVCALIKFSF